MGEFDHNAKVVSKRIVDDSLFVMRFRCDDDVNFVPGQYCSIILRGRKPVPLSIASSAYSKDLEFGIAAKGDSTCAIRDLAVGDFATLKGPFGRFILGDHKRVCLIAGGVGVTPFLSMMRTISDSSAEPMKGHDCNQSVDAKLLYSVRSEKSLLWDELLLMNDVYVTFSQDDVPGFHHGRIDSAFILKNVPDIEKRTCYLCGSHEFVLAMSLLLESLGVSKNDIVKEMW